MNKEKSGFSIFAVQGIVAVFLFSVNIGGSFASDEMKQVKPMAKIIVDAGKIERIDTPVEVTLPTDVLGQAMRLIEVRDGIRVPVVSQIARDGKGEKLCWVLADKTPAGSKRVYELEKGAPVECKGIEVKDHDSAFEVLCGDKRVLRYKYGVEPPPEGKDKNYARSGFIHPVWTPAGQVLTSIHAPDHIHHMGLWNAWTHTEFEGRQIDFWNIKDGKATVRFAKCLEKSNGPVFGGFKVVQEHVDLSAPGGSKIVLNEELEVRAWNVGNTGRKCWLFDWTSIQRCASSSPLHLLQYRYGGFGFRATLDWGTDNSDYLTSEGKTRADGHASRARWGAMTGKTAAGEAGLLMMAHPLNREYPEPLRIWGKDNKEGKIFFNFCPIQQKDWMLEPGNDYVFRYRMCAYDGTISGNDAERLWSDFGCPPEVKLEKLAE